MKPEKYTSLGITAMCFYAIYGILGCGSPTGQTGTASAEAPAKPAPEPRTSDAPREFILSEVDVAQTLQWYAYGQSCHAFVNAK